MKAYMKKLQQRTGRSDGDQSFVGDATFAYATTELQKARAEHRNLGKQIWDKLVAVWGARESQCDSTNFGEVRGPAQLPQEAPGIGHAVRLGEGGKAVPGRCRVRSADPCIMKMPGSRSD